MKKIGLIILVLTAFSSQAQFGVGGGLSMIAGFGSKKVYPGLHIGFEIPRDDQVSFYGRMTLTLSNEGTKRTVTTVQAISPSTNPQYKNVSYSLKMNYINFEGGTRYYLGNGYDFGWSAYGGTLFMVSLNPVKSRFYDFDPTVYRLTNDMPMKASILSMSLGLNFGVKNHFAFGMLYLDANIGYNIFSIPSNTFINSSAAAVRELYSPLFFAVNFGFRKDFY